MTKKKTLALLACAVVLVLGSVAATMAYLTATTDQVNNTFTVGDVAITLDEKDVDDSTANKERDIANNYHIFPGGNYEKDPTVHVGATSEDAWLFVKVYNGIERIEADSDDIKTIAEQMEANGWTAVNNADGWFKYNRVVTKADTNIVVFSEFTIADTVDGATLGGYGSETIKVFAYAVQADGFDTAEAAWGNAPCTTAPF